MDNARWVKDKYGRVNKRVKIPEYKLYLARFNGIEAKNAGNYCLFIQSTKSPNLVEEGQNIKSTPIEPSGNWSFQIGNCSFFL